MSLSNKSQIWLEAIVLIFLFASVLTFLGITSINTKSSLFKQNIVYQATKTLELVSNRINTVLFEGDGFSSNLIIPEKINEFDYNITFSTDYAILEVVNITILSNVFAKNITGTIIKGENWVKNQNGTININ